MRFIISEHKLDKVIFKFIHDYIGNTFERSQFGTFIVYSTLNTDPTFGYDEVKLEHDSEDGRLYIDKDFLMTISNIFGLTPLDAQLKIYDWFKWYEDVETKYLDTPRVSVYNLDERG